MRPLDRHTSTLLRGLGAMWGMALATSVCVFLLTLRVSPRLILATSMYGSVVPTIAMGVDASTSERPVDVAGHVVMTIMVTATAALVMRFHAC